MKLTQIRNATMIIEYGGSRFLIDPLLGEKGAYPGFEGTENSHLRYPTADLPMPMEAILDVDAVIVTHTHADHWDEAAQKLIPKDKPIFAQHGKDCELIKSQGFTDVRCLSTQGVFKDVKLDKTPGQHGSDALLQVMSDLMGEVCGVVFTHPAEKTAYIAGDTVWNRFVAESLKKHRPDVVILNAGDAKVNGFGSIIMGKQDVYEVLSAAPDALVVATHMEAVNHATLSRKELHDFIQEKGLSERLLIPNDGQICCF